MCTVTATRARRTDATSVRYRQQQRRFDLTAQAKYIIARIHLRRCGLP
jgi:hypothetical protein